MGERERASGTSCGECERWEEYRIYRVDDELLAGLPPAALLCGLALDSFTGRQQKIWMRVQEQCSAILERHQLELCKPHTQSARACPQTSQPLANAPMRMPEPATPAQWSRGSFLAVSHNPNVASSRVPWMFSRAQYNRMCHWLAWLAGSSGRRRAKCPQVCQS